MAQPTTIEWCRDPRTGDRGFSWNVCRGCSRVSPGCQNCYAERIAARFSRRGGPFQFFADQDQPESKWTGRVEIIKSKLDEPLKRRKPTLYFCNSMSDLFHEKLSDDDIDNVFAVMALCPQHLFLILTKRAERMAAYISDVIAACGTETRRPSVWSKSWPLPNVWLGVTVEDNAHRDRLDWLMQTPAALRFVSLEPILSDIELRNGDDGQDWLTHTCCRYGRGQRDDGSDACNGPGCTGTRLDWVICGGESGPGARPMHPDWARRLRDDCQAADIPYFFKSWGEWVPKSQGFHATYGRRWGVIEAGGQFTETGTCWNGHDDDGSGEAIMIRVGRKITGRLLDGHEYSEMPEVR